MNISNSIRFLKRHYIKILSAAILTAALSGMFYYVYRSGSNVNATVFINIGAKKGTATDDKSTALDLVQASDQFTETVQGWFKNPEFTERIGEPLNLQPSLTARRQDKQNLLVTFSSGDESVAKRISQNIRENLLADIGAYNRNTGAGFQVALFSASYKPASPAVLILVIILGLVLGAGIGKISCYLYELLFGKVTCDWQAEQILGKKSLDIVPRRISKKANLTFIREILEKSHSRNYDLIGVDYNPLELQKKLSEHMPSKKITSFSFPENTGEILVQHGTENLVICRLGRSSAADLIKLKSILPDGFGLIIQE